MTAERKAKLKEILMDLLFDIIGGILYAAGIYSFASQAEFAPGGISGLAIIINHFTQWPIGICTLVLNIPIVIICIRTLGKKFFFKSIKTMVISTVIIDFVFPLLPVYKGDALMAALFAGALSGAGLALVYWRGSSTGGTDFLIMSLRKKFPHLSIGTISICIDGMVILLGGIVFGRIDAVLQGIVMTAVSTTVIDKITAGFMTGQVTFIVTGKPKEISDEIKGLQETLNEHKQQQTTAQNVNSRITEIFDILENEKFNFTEYDDAMVRSLIDSIKVLTEDQILVTFKGGFEMEQKLQ